MSQARFQKQARERARREKAEAKKERREALQAAALTTEAPSSSASQEDVLAELADLHLKFEAGTIEFVDFEQRKHELMAQLSV